MNLGALHMAATRPQAATSMPMKRYHGKRRRANLARIVATVPFAVIGALTPHR